MIQKISPKKIFRNIKEPNKEIKTILKSLEINQRKQWSAFEDKYKCYSNNKIDD